MTDEGRGWFRFAAVVIMGLLAYRSLWWQPLSVDVGNVFFASGALPPSIVAAIACWLLWRARTSFDGVPTRVGLSAACFFGVVGVSLFAWARLSGKSDLLFLSLAANGIAWAIATHGWSGFRAARLPALVLCFGVRIPKPIEDELVWSLQLGTARGSGWLLDAIGREFFQAGVMLRDAEHTFHVIDTCSGLTGNLILILVAICAAVVLGLQGWRFWFLVGFSPFVGYVVNILRATYVAASPDPEALAAVGADHTLQGVVVLMGGTAFLYILGWLLGGRAQEVRPGVAATRVPNLVGWNIALTCLVGLFVFSFVVPSFTVRTSQEGAAVHFSTEGGGWTSEEAPSDSMFNGVVSGKFHRRYRHVEDGDRQLWFVDILIGGDTDGRSFPARIFSSKRRFPGPDWNLVQHGRERIWILGQDVDVALAAPKQDAEHAWVFAWRPRYEGILRESWRHLLALDASPFQRDASPSLVKIVAYSPHGGAHALDQAKKRLNRFVKTFRDELMEL